MEKSDVEIILTIKDSALSKKRKKELEAFLKTIQPELLTTAGATTKEAIVSICVIETRRRRPPK